MANPSRNPEKLQQIVAAVNLGPATPGGVGVRLGRWHSNLPTILAHLASDGRVARLGNYGEAIAAGVDVFGSGQNIKFVRRDAVIYGPKWEIPFSRRCKPGGGGQGPYSVAGPVYRSGFANWPRGSRRGDSG